MILVLARKGTGSDIRFCDISLVLAFHPFLCILHLRVGEQALAGGVTAAGDAKKRTGSKWNVEGQTFDPGVFGVSSARRANVRD